MGWVGFMVLFKLRRRYAPRIIISSWGRDGSCGVGSLFSIAGFEVDGVSRGHVILGDVLGGPRMGGCVV